MTPLLQAFGLALMMLVWSGPLTAQTQNIDKRAAIESHNSTVTRVNGGRVGIISGGIGGTYIRIATDLASVLDEGDRVRVLPIMGKGSVQNITDILYLKGVDIGIVQSDVLSFMKSQAVHRNIEARIQYITKLYNEEFHLVSSSSVTSVKDLAGKKVNFGVKGSGTAMTASTVFTALGIKVVPVHFDQALALEKIKKGEIAATVYVAGKPARAVSSLKAKSGLRLLPVPFGGKLQETYLPARLTAEDYPGLVKKGDAVNTIAVGAVMAVFNWRPGNSRYLRVVKFIDAFFSKFDEFQKAPRHPKWREVNLAAKLPGWTRFSHAERWLAENQPQPSANLRKNFKQFVAAQGPRTALSQPQLETLFKEFERWQQARQ
jgi:TRAP transporter TAXI family solute receptor